MEGRAAIGRAACVWRYEIGCKNVGRDQAKIDGEVIGFPLKLWMAASWESISSFTLGYFR
eukprot:scaffold90627_cov20-Cyclotella_meneghiniana.AAC.1